MYHKHIIKVFNNISAVGLNKFPDTHFEFFDDTDEPSIILLRSHNLHSYKLNNDLIAVGRAGAGTNNVPVDNCSEKGIVVFNTPGANANAVKELVIGSLLNVARKISDGVNYTKSLTYETDLNSTIEANKKAFKGFELYGKKLGVIGLGAIGMMVANSALQFGMEVEGYDPFLSVNNAWALSSDVKPAENLKKMLAASDFISVHMPLTEKTKCFFDVNKIQYIKKGGVLLNFSRAGIVHEESILQALSDNHLQYFVSDFPTRNLLKHDKVICTPHLGASTIEAEENCAVMIANQIKDFVLNGNILNSVNFPNCSLERSGESRLVIANKNIPSIIGGITSILAEKSLNITEMVNKSRENLAFNIVELNGVPSDDVISKVKNIEGVLSVRSIIYS